MMRWSWGRVARRPHHWIAYSMVVGLAAGFAFAVFEMIMAAFLDGRQALVMPLRMIGALVLGDQALAPSYPLGPAVAAGVLVHVVLSVLFAMIFGAVVAAVPTLRRSGRALIAVASLYGLLLWLVNFYVIAPLAGWTWFPDQTNELVQVLAHTIFFGAVLGNLGPLLLGAILRLSPPLLMKSVRRKQQSSGERLRSRPSRATTQAVAPIPASDMVAAILAASDTADDSRRARARTGLPTLDAVIGGFIPKTVTALLGEPNLGKTTLVNQWAYEAAAGGLPVLYVSFDNPPEELVHKHLTRLGFLAASPGGAVAPAGKDATVQFGDTVGQRLSYLNGTAALRVATIGEIARDLLERQSDIDHCLIIIDNLQRLAASTIGDDSHANPGEDASAAYSLGQELRDLAVATSSPVLGVANTGVHPAELQVERVVEQTADLVLTLNRDTSAEASAPALASEARPLRLDVTKHRYGPGGHVSLSLVPTQCRIEERPESRLRTERGSDRSTDASVARATGLSHPYFVVAQPVIPVTHDQVGIRS